MRDGLARHSCPGRGRGAIPIAAPQRFLHRRRKRNWPDKLGVHKWSMHVVEERMLQKHIFSAWNTKGVISAMGECYHSILFFTSHNNGGGGVLFKGVLLGMNES